MSYPDSGKDSAVFSVSVANWLELPALHKGVTGSNSAAGRIQLIAQSRSRGGEFEPQLGHIIFVEIDHERMFAAILPLPLNQEPFTITDTNLCTSTE